MRLIERDMLLLQQPDAAELERTYPAQGHAR